MGFQGFWTFFYMILGWFGFLTDYFQTNFILENEFLLKNQKLYCRLNLKSSKHFLCFWKSEKNYQRKNQINLTPKKYSKCSKILVFLQSKVFKVERRIKKMCFLDSFSNHPSREHSTNSLAKTHIMCITGRKLILRYKRICPEVLSIL